jgi:hypothetical protein
MTVVWAMTLLSAPVGLGARVEFFSLHRPGDAGDIEQASGLHFGRIGSRDGLWLVCDRNGGASGGRLFFISSATLKRAEHRGKVVADAAFPIALPSGSWSSFADDHRAVGADALADLHRRMGASTKENDGALLDLEAVTIAPGIAPPHDPHVFVVAEEPHSTVLELVVEGEGTTSRARLVGAYDYAEAADEHGTSNNDGLEGLAYAGEPGRFYWGEEGTKLHGPDAHPRLFFLDPRVGRSVLASGRFDVEQPLSEMMTQRVHDLRRGRMQTLNALTVTADGQVLAVDRNGGWILRLGVQPVSATRWLNLYDLDGVNLREALAVFPGPRRMPYISIEGIAVDGAGALWLVDDPAMPEAFRASCLLRVRDVNVAQGTKTRSGSGRR